MTSPDDGANNIDGRRFGKATWVIIGGISALAIAFAAMVAFGSVIAPRGSDEADSTTTTETAQESATSGLGYNTTGKTEPSSAVGSNASVLGSNSTGQMPDSEITYGRETSTSELPSENNTVSP